MQALHFALSGLTIEQKIQANNIANVDVPGFAASRVDFSTSLQRALSASKASGPVAATVSITPSSNSAGTNGNNVSISQELVGIEQSTTWYQAVTTELNNQYHLVRGSAGGAF